MTPTGYNIREGSAMIARRYAPKTAAERVRMFYEEGCDYPRILAHSRIAESTLCYWLQEAARYREWQKREPHPSNRDMRAFWLGAIRAERSRR